MLVKDNQSNIITNGEKTLSKSQKQRSRPIIEINSVHDLTFESFIDSEMNKFNAKVTGTEKRVFHAKVSKNH